MLFDDVKTSATIYGDVIRICININNALFCKTIFKQVKIRIIKN